MRCSDRDKLGRPMYAENCYISEKHDVLAIDMACWPWPTIDPGANQLPHQCQSIYLQRRIVGVP